MGAHLSGSLSKHTSLVARLEIHRETLAFERVLVESQKEYSLAHKFRGVSGESVAEPENNREKDL
jgi:hypothetical protein